MGNMGATDWMKAQSITLVRLPQQESSRVTSTSFDDSNPERAGNVSAASDGDEPYEKNPRRRPDLRQSLGGVGKTVNLWCREYILRRPVVLDSKDGRRIELDVMRRAQLIDERTGKEYMGNAVRSSRYTLWNFIPCQLWFQFSKIANFYFLICGILQLIPGLSTTGTYTTILPLLFFLCFSIGREGYDDFRRYRLDRVENRRQTRVLYGNRPGGVESNIPLSWTDNALEIWKVLKPRLFARIEKTRLGSTRQPVAESYDDEERHAPIGQDPNAGLWATVRWMDLRVGDVIELHRDEQVPADIVLLSANGREGLAYIETMALDGETNLKRKEPQGQLGNSCNSLEDLFRCHAQFVLENPNRHLHQFEGRVSIGGETFPITLGNVVCRGSVLRNTPRAMGLVVNTGEESKIRMNASHEPKGKAPAMQAYTNKVVITLVIFWLLLSAGCTAGYEIWAKVFEDKAWYLADAHLPFEDALFAFLIEFNNYIPLALYVSMEIIKVFQFWLLHDIEMYDEATDTPFVANTQTIFENLGQVNHIFTDKTGTLTENIMRFRKMSVAGMIWNHNAEKPESGATNEKDVMSGKVDTQVTSNESTLGVPGVTISPVLEDEISEAEPSTLQENADPRKEYAILEHLREHPGTAFAQKVQLFLLSMALCHTCFPEKQDDGETTFQAESPDEFALVEAARDLGYLVIERDARSIQLLVQNSNTTTPVFETYEVLDVVEFSSSRKRMSIIVRFPDGRICLLCKGADGVVQQKLRLKSLAGEKAAESKREHQELADEMARDEIMRKSQNVDVRNSFSQPRISMDTSAVSRMARASLDVPSIMSRPSLMRRRSAMSDSSNTSLPRKSFGRRSTDDLLSETDDLDEASVFEKCFQHIDEFATEGLRTLLYGYRFIDDTEYAKWHEMYNSANTSLVDRQNQIEAAGDKIERDLELAGATAIEDKLQNGVPETIEKLKRANVTIWMLSGDKRETAVNIAHSSMICEPYSKVFVLDQSSSFQLQIDAALLALEIGNIAHSVVVIDGWALELIESAGLSNPLYELLLRVDSVVCCRATPSQKAGMVKAVRHRVPKSMTLAIGDGGNDIAMIQEAHVGVGISGKEGLQAARIADYSIAQFRFLQRLLFIHGHWNYDRTAKYILSTFWKEMMFYSVQVLYQRWNGYTGTSLYENDSLTVYNTLFTSLAVMIPGIFEQDLKATTLLAVPELYAYGQQSRGFNMALYAFETVIAGVESVIIYFMIYTMYGIVTGISDQGLFAFGDLAFSIGVVFINVKLLILQYHHKTLIPLISAFITISGWWIWNFFLSAIYTNSPGEVTVYRGFTAHFGRDIVWWIIFVVVLMVVLLLELVISVLRKVYWPTAIDVWQVLEQDENVGRKIEERGKEGYGSGDISDREFDLNL